MLTSIQASRKNLCVSPLPVILNSNVWLYKYKQLLQAVFKDWRVTESVAHLYKRRLNGLSLKSQTTEVAF